MAARRSRFAPGARTLAALAAFGLVAAAPAAAAPPSVDAAAAKQGTDKFDPDYLLGRWTDKGDCSDWVTFFGDGCFTTISGGAGVWELNGHQLTLTGGAGTTVLQIFVIDQDTMRIVNPDNSVGQSTRC
jgi:hypothetical protein